MLKQVWASHRNVVIASVVAVLAVILAGGTLMLAVGGQSSPTPSPIAAATPTATPSPTETATPTASPTFDISVPTADLGPTPIPPGWTYSDLDGVVAPANLAHRLPIALMVDDNTVARPQSGFSSASIVIQAAADGGEDRYLLIFQEGTSTDIGPVRSARPYFVTWAAEYKPVFGHYGGDQKTLTQTIPSMAKYIYNMDALNAGSCPYHRISTRLQPHNAYTNSAVQISCSAKRGYPATYQKLPTRPFMDDTPLADRPASQTISVPYRTGTIGYVYDPTLDAYRRLIGGQPQYDAANDAAVYARNIVVMFQGVGTDPNSEPGHARPVVANVGYGQAIVFREGKAIAGTWKKTSNAALTRFYDKSGKEIPFVRGEIFLQSVAPGTKVTY